MSYGNKPNEIRHPQAALLANSYVVHRVQSLGYTADLNSEDVYQLTDANVVEVVDSDPTVSLSIDVNEFGSIDLYNRLAGLYITGMPDNTNANDGTISHTDFEDTATDFIVAIKDTATGTTQSRALWFNNCVVDSISATYQVDGFASESVSLTGNGQRWFLNAWASARVGTIWQTNPSLPYLDGSFSGADGSTVIVTEDGIVLDEQYWGIWPNTGDITAENGYVFNTSKRYRQIFIPNTNTFPSLSDPTSPVGGVKEGEIEIILWDNTRNTEPGIGTSGASWSKALRVQSVDFEFSYDREDLKQLYTGTYAKGLNSSSITATISVNDSDLELWAMASGKYGDWTTSDVSSISLTDFQSMSNMSLRIDVFNTKDYLLHAPGTLLKSITLLDGKLTSVGDTRDVPGRGSQSLDITFKRGHFTGTGLVGR